VARDAEGRVAMTDYLREQQHTLDRTARLKAMRLARETAEKTTVKKAPRSRAVTRVKL